jgi:hypothetical protein
MLEGVVLRFSELEGGQRNRVHKAANQHSPIKISKHKRKSGGPIFWVLRGWAMETMLMIPRRKKDKMGCLSVRLVF